MIYHDNFDGTSFHQTAAEYFALCIQTFKFAELQLTRNLTKNSAGKRCVIFDLDETILDNSRANAALIRDGKLFDEAGNWKEWCNRKQTGLVSGAKDFVLSCRNNHQIDVFYITSRIQSDVREATKADLMRHKLPLETSDDPMVTNLFMKKMGSFTAPSGNTYTLDDKFQQRDFLIRERGYSVALILGDNLSDWEAVYGNGTAYQLRTATLLANVARLGEEFILLPNPMYGSWLFTLNSQHADSAVPNSLQPITSFEAPRLKALSFP